MPQLAPQEVKQPTSSPSPKDAPPSGTASSAGRGGLALAAGKLFFLVTGLVQQIALKVVLGLSGYGAFSTAQSVASICYNPLIQSGIQGVSRTVAPAEGEELGLIQGRLMRLHSVGALFSAALFLLFAAPLAKLIGAPHIVGGLRLLSGIMLIYGLYAPIVGVLNGRRRFIAQAGLDMLSASLRTIGLVGGAYFATRFLSTGSEESVSNTQVEGTVLGFCVAATVWLIVSVRVAGLGKSGGVHPKTSSYLRIILPILGGQILLNLLFQADSLLLRKFAADAALVSGLRIDTADRYVGAYRATQLFCFLPFQLLTSLTFVLFPLLARAQAQGEQKEVAHLIKRGLRLATIVAGLIISAFVTVPGGLLAIVFGSEAAELGTSAMRILASGMGFFALLGVMTSAMNSVGAERVSLSLFAIAVLLVGALAFALGNGTELSSGLLTRVALATTLAMVLATGVGAFLLGKLTGGSLSPLTLLRTAGSVALIGWGLSRFFESDPTASKLQIAIPTVLGTGAAFLSFLLLMVATGELRKNDLRDLTGLWRKN